MQRGGEDERGGAGQGRGVDWMRGGGEGGLFEARGATLASQALRGQNVGGEGGCEGEGGGEEVGV